MASTAPSCSAGDILIASPWLDDPNFARSVVLLCEHRPLGAVGLILNRTTGLTLDRVVEDAGPFTGTRTPVDCGGPVGVDRLHVLHAGSEGTPGSASVLPGVQFGGDIETLAQLHDAGTPVRFLLGYAGWDVEQLEAELMEGSWEIARASRRAVFETPASELWRSLLLMQGGQYDWLRHRPANPSDN